MGDVLCITYNPPKRVIMMFTCIRIFFNILTVICDFDDALRRAISFDRWRDSSTRVTIEYKSNRTPR